MVRGYNHCSETGEGVWLNDVIDLWESIPFQAVMAPLYDENGAIIGMAQVAQPLPSLESFLQQGVDGACARWLVCSFAHL